MTPAAPVFSAEELATFRRAIRAKIERDLAREQRDAQARRERVVPAVRRGVEQARSAGLLTRAWLFGSYAWGAPGERSDIDLLVADGLDPEHIAAVVGRDIALDVHVVRLEEAPDSLRERVLREGIAL